MIADADLAGVSTRRVDKLLRALGIEGISKSRVSEIAKGLDQAVDAFRPGRSWARSPTSDSTPWWCAAAMTGS